MRADVVVIGAGALGSATAWQLARRGVDVVLLEQFAFGHGNGASHDTSRILRRSYHTPGYVALAREAYDDWATLEGESGDRLVTRTGGLDLFPPDAAIPPDDYTTSLDAGGVPYDRLTDREVTRRWPMIALPAGTTAIFQKDTAIVHAARTTATLQRLARDRGARLFDRTPVTGLAGTTVSTPSGPIAADRVVVTADAWTNEILAPLGVRLPLTVLREQVTYFAPDRPERFADLPVWIWMDDPSYYGFPPYEGPLVKAAQDCGGAETTARDRSFDVDASSLTHLDTFLTGLLPGVGRPEKTVTCLYTLTPDRDFVVDAVPDHPDVLVGLGAAHAFKFAPTLGRILADLATKRATSSDIEPFRWNRPALVDPGFRPTWLV
jgi:sarcosine oxidase